MDVAKVKNLNAKTRGGCEMRTVGIIISIMCIIVISSGVALGDDWHIETVDTTLDVGPYTSIALDTYQNPHISYYDDHYNDLKYAHYDGSSWHIESIDTTGYVGTYTSIALDTFDYPHISYYDNNYYGLKYAYYDGSSWQIVYIDIIGNMGHWTSIALDTSDNPHISYQDCTNYDLKYTYYDGSSWHIESIDTSGSVGFYTSIALDIYDNPYISYFESAPVNALYCAYYDGSSWHIEYVDATGIVGTYTSITMDTSQNPHISYLDDTNGDLKYAYYDGYSWHTESVDTTVGEYVGEWTSIALDTSNNPHISYCREYSIFLVHGLKYAYYDGSSWQIEYVDGTAETEDVGKYTSIALDTSNNPHISYYDGTNGDLKYAWYGPDVGINLKHFIAHPEGKTITLNWSVETTEGEEIVGFNLYRRELGLEDGVGGVGGHHDALLREDVANIWLKINPTLITGGNPYTYTDSDVESGLAYEYKLEAVLADDNAETLGTTQATAGIPPAYFAILALYPNPASDALNCLLAVPETGTVELLLYDISGRLVLSKQFEASEPTELEAQLNISGLASGVYTLRASFGGAEVSPACGGVAVLVR